MTSAPGPYGPVTLHSAQVGSADGTDIHYVVSEPVVPAGHPVLVVPGMGEDALDYETLLTALVPRPAAAVSVRGRGSSGAPPRGYRFEDHVADLEAVVDDLAWDRFAVVTFSRGSSYGLGLALRRPSAVAALAVGDYWARHVGLPASAVDMFAGRRWRGRSMSERMPEHAVAQLVAESEEIPMWDQLGDLPCPLLLLRPGRKALLDDETVARWAEHAGRLRVVELGDAAHDLWGTDPDGVLSALRPFLDDAEG